MLNKVKYDILQEYCRKERHSHNTVSIVKYTADDIAALHIYKKND